MVADIDGGKTPGGGGLAAWVSAPPLRCSWPTGPLSPMLGGLAVIGFGALIAWATSRLWDSGSEASPLVPPAACSGV